MVSTIAEDAHDAAPLLKQAENFPNSEFFVTFVAFCSIRARAESKAAARQGAEQ
jgi:hypothetical protein